MPDLQCLTVRNRVIGSTAGNIMRRPLPSTIPGRPWCCPSRRMPNRPHLRSHSGPWSSSLFHGSPTQVEYTVQPVLFRTLLLERLRLPVQVTEYCCEFGAPLDELGRHRKACPKSGRLRSRAPAKRNAPWHECAEKQDHCQMQLPIARHECRSPGPRTSAQSRWWRLVFLCTMVPNSLWTSRSDQHSQLQASSPPNASHMDGAFLVRARRDKERKCAELLEGDRCHLVVVGVEKAGRWSEEAFKFVNALAAAKARETPAILRRSAHFFSFARGRCFFPCWRTIFLDGEQFFLAGELFFPCDFCFLLGDFFVVLGRPNIFDSYQRANKILCCWGFFLSCRRAKQNCVPFVAKSSVFFPAWRGGEGAKHIILSCWEKLFSTWREKQFSHLGGETFFSHVGNFFLC